MNKIETLAEVHDRRGSHRWVAIKKGFPQKICKCGSLRVGTKTVYLGDQIRYDATAAPAAAGQVGMNLATGRMQQFVGGAARDVANLTDLVLQTALFTFTHLSGAVSTGALGFTPAFAIYVAGVAKNTVGSFASCTGIIAGTGVLARSTGWAQTVTPIMSPTVDGDSAAGISAVVSDALLTAWDEADLDVTAFGAGGITLTWSSAITGHTGHLLVVGF